MIFGRKKKTEATEEPETTDADATTDETVDETGDDGADTASEDAEPGADGAEAAEAGDVEDADALDVAALDETEWRTNGPFEETELHDPDARGDEDGDDDGADGDRPRIDLGSIVVTPAPGSELRLQVDEAQNIVSAMLVLPITGPTTNGTEAEVVGSSALELSAYAAPRSGGLWAELRDEIAEAATAEGGEVSLAAGPFGVELRRLLRVQTPSGEEGYQPSRMWVAEGPRWLLRGIVYGQAAIESDDEDPSVVAVLEAFRAVVVRRGDEAMAPGDLLPMTMPTDLQPAD